MQPEEALLPNLKATKWNGDYWLEILSLCSYESILHGLYAMTQRLPCVDSKFHTHYKSFSVT